MTGYLTLAGLKSPNLPVSGLRDDHPSTTSGASAIFCYYSATTYGVYAAIKLFHNAHAIYGFFGNPNAEKETV
jgi:hypothetical protein